MARATPQMLEGLGRMVPFPPRLGRAEEYASMALEFVRNERPDLIICDAWFQRKINDFYEGFVTTERSEQIGGMMIKKLMHPITGQLVNVVVDRHCPSGYAYLLDTRYTGYITIDPFFFEKLAKDGDYEIGQTVGEYGFCVAYEKAHSILYGYSTSA